MDIRFATEKDIPAIVELQKLSLGQSLMPKSKEYWHWKHIANPFGTSPVLLATENNQIVGVRAFMNWQWHRNHEVIRAVRAVDTATHPDFQGKGIFKRLTLDLLAKCIKEGVDLVFNTPNSLSKPGYLKMGWQENGNLPVSVSLKKPISVLRNMILAAKEVEFLELEHKRFSVESTIENWKENTHGLWSTKCSEEYLRWRYFQIPLIKYYGHCTEKAGFIFRLKQGALGIELRVCDCFGEFKSIGGLIKEVYDYCDFDYMSACGLTKIILPGRFKKKLNIGPEVTIKRLNNNMTIGFSGFKSWSPSIGDLEVF